MTDLFPPNLDGQIAEIERELLMRIRVYPRFVATGKPTQAKADRQIEIMRAVLYTLKATPR